MKKVSFSDGKYNEKNSQNPIEMKKHTKNHITVLFHSNRASG